ncbi:Cilia- and flagella-associated protein 20 [Takifugu flavidus]|uniref:Cilia-and flagella-associated protein 20 n=1 Tax=Takifugu flavidus TaxID=433684 RepID=A0A5C6MXD1_9TELE|nr:Cilia- and flagella-associated protein 20 [Takifugu flavidus]
MDEEIKSLVTEVQGRNLQTAYLSFPLNPEDNLGISQPIFNMFLKKTGEHFFCKITAIDDKSIRRQIFLTTFRKKMNVRVFSGCVPIRLPTSWDYVVIDLAEFTYQLFKTKYVKTVEIQVNTGHVKRVKDEDIKSLAIELQGRNMRTTYISYPHDPEDNVGIRQPILNLLMKNTGGDCGLEITVTDDNSIRRRIFLSTFRKEMKVSVFSGFVPLRLSTYWDYIIINLAELTHQLFGTKYVKTLKIQIHANCRIQRVYFSDRLYSQQDLPHDWKENEAAPSINEVMASGVPSGSGHWGHGNRYNELRSGTCCQPTAAVHNCQPGFRSILYSTGWSLLKFWNIEVKNGHVKSVMDEDIKSFSIEVQGSSQTTYISFPHDLEDNLGIRQPIFNMLLKKSGEDFFCKITVSTSTFGFCEESKSTGHWYKYQ